MRVSKVNCGGIATFEAFYQSRHRMTSPAEVNMQLLMIVGTVDTL